MSIEKRFSILRLVATVYKVIGIIIAIVTILSALGICGMSFLGGAAMDSMFSGGVNPRNPSMPLALGGAFGGILIGVGILLYGLIVAIALYAGGEIIYLMIALEENTRATRSLLELRS